MNDKTDKNTKDEGRNNPKYCILISLENGMIFCVEAFFCIQPGIRT
jgi:hypothetical protein